MQPDAGQRPINMTGASGHPVEAHNGSFLADVINRTSTRVWGYFCSFQQMRNTLESAKKSKVLVRWLRFKNPKRALISEDQE
jgi:hypothetical protein